MRFAIDDEGGFFMDGIGIALVPMTFHLMSSDKPNAVFFRGTGNKVTRNIGVIRIATNHVIAEHTMIQIRKLHIFKALAFLFYMIGALAKYFNDLIARAITLCADGLGHFQLPSFFFQLPR